MNLTRTDQPEPVTEGAAAELTLALPEPGLTFEQGDEWCVVKVGGQWREIRFHDYADIFTIPGLYEKLFYQLLECQSPTVIRELLTGELDRRGIDPSSLRVLDLGAGNGIVGEEVRSLGAAQVVGADILPEAGAAAHRDRPTVYTEYLVADITDLPPADHDRLSGYRFNTLTCVAALGFADIPPAAFRAAYNLVEDGGSVAFTLKDEFVSDQDSTGFAGLIKRATTSGSLEIADSRHYRHRLSVDGTPLHYVAFVGTKHSDLPADLLP